MTKEKKIEKILEVALTEDLSDYYKLLKILKKQLGLFGGTKRITGALLKEQLGDISRMDLKSGNLFSKTDTGRIIFEDIKDGKARLFINIGKNHNVYTGDLIREIVKRSGLDGKSVGKIDVHATYSFFEVPESFAEMVYHSFEGAKIKGVSVVVEPAKRRKRNG
jgi:DbpA-like RNA binding protein